jgi:DNA polymerase/3'-5' exonuclease PolX
MSCSTNKNPTPPCPDGFTQKTNKKQEECCYKSTKKEQKETHINIKELIIFNLNTLISHHRNMKEPFKANAYRKALDRIKLLEEIKDEDDIKDIGGDKTKDKLKQIINSKQNLQQVQEIIKNSTFTIVNELMEIHGIGPVAANELVNTHGIKSITDMKKNQHLLNDVQKKGLKYATQIKKRIPREELLLHDEFLKVNLKGIIFNITGSYRREAMDSGDIDVLLTGPQNNLKYCKDLLLKSKYMLKDGIFADGEHKLMGMCRLKNTKVARRIDMLFTPLNEYPFALLYFTGNSQFNINMRAHALTLGLSLNEQGLFFNDSKKHVDHEFNTEKDIFDYLQLSYVEPNKRI